MFGCALDVMLGRIPSGWIVDVWNCHGVLKLQEFAGYGSKDDEMLEHIKDVMNADYTWFECGWYSVPIRQSTKETVERAGLADELARRLEKVLNWIVYDRNGGAINFSGFYMVAVDELEAVEKTIQRVLLKAKNKLNETKAIGALASF